MPHKTLTFKCYADDWGRRPFVTGGEKRERVVLALLPGEPIPISGFDALFHK